MADFKPENFFDLSEFPYKELFKGVDMVWDALKKREGLIEKLTKGKVIIGKNTTIEEGAMIKAPTIIGDNCFIAQGAYIRGGVILGNNVQIGHAVELKGCVLLNNSTIAHFNYIGDSIIGNRVNFSAGSVTANFRLDKKMVRVKSKGYIETGLQKFGAVVGDDSNIGVNSVLNPGTILGKKSVVYPLVSVNGVYPADSTIK